MTGSRRHPSLAASTGRRFLLAALIPLILLALVAIPQWSADRDAALSLQNTLTAESAAASVHGYIEAPAVLVSGARSLTTDEIVSRRIADTMLDSRLNDTPFIESVLVIDARGRVVDVALDPALTVPESEFVGIDLSRVPAHRQVARTGRTAWSDVFTSITTGRTSIEVVGPTRDGMVAVTVPLDRLDEALTPGLHLDPAVTLSVVDAHGVPLLHTGEADITQRPNWRDMEPVAAATRGRYGPRRYRWRGVDYVGATTPIVDTGWTVLVSRDSTEADAPVNRARAGLAALAALATLVAVVLARLQSGAVSSPVRRLAGFARQVASGEYASRMPQLRYRELEDLAEDMRLMGGAIEAREEALRASENRYRFVIETLRGVPWEYDATMDRFTYVGPQAGEMLGYPPSEWTDLASWAAMIHPEDRDASVKSCATATSAGADHDLEYRIVRPDGSVIRVHEVITVTVGEDGHVTLTGVLLDVTDAREAAEMRSAAELAREASRAKSQFLANMSHELRTPLNSIIGFSGVMLRGMSGELTDEQRRQLEMIANSGTRLLDLVNGVLDLSRIEAGRAEVSPVGFEVGELAHEVAAMMHPLAVQRGLSLQVETPSEPVTVFTDRGMLHQILSNLVSNAVKYTDEGGATVTVHPPAGDWVSVTVRDTGCGFPESELPHLFEQFHRMGRPEGESTEGAGLGLAISERLSRVLGGSIEVVSEPGAGSAFTVHVPADVRGRTGQVDAGSGTP